MDGKVMRRLIFTPLDLGAKIKACATMSCSDSDLRRRPRSRPGRRAADELLVRRQRPESAVFGDREARSAELTTDTPQRLAGKLVIDDSAAGGAKVNIDFDATLLKDLQNSTRQ